MASSFQQKHPTSLTRPAPMWLIGCHTANGVPWSSANTAMRPLSKMSIGGTMVDPPASATAAAVASMSVTVM